MEGFGGLGISDVSSSVRKKRSNTSRRPRNEPRAPSDNLDNSSPSDVSKGLSDDDDDDDDDESGLIVRTKEINMLCGPRKSFSNNDEFDSMKSGVKIDDRGLVESDEASNNGSFRGSNESKRCSKFNSVVADDFDEKNSKVKKVKLKVGGVTHTIHAKSISDSASSAVGSSNSKASRISNASQPRHMLKQGSSESLDKVSGNVSMIGEMYTLGKDENRQPVRKSNRVSKRRIIDEVADDGLDEEDKVYLEKLNTSQVSRDFSAVRKERESKRHHRTLKVSKRNSSDARYDKSQSDDTDYVEEESISDDEPSRKKKKHKKEAVDDSIVDRKNGMTVTTRQRALQSGKDVPSNFNTPIIEFPDGLPPAPPRKQKDKLSEVEQQLKKAEAAQRRRIQVEKAARESEAEAIRKILGQDSSRKKREEKIKKQREDLAQEKAANAMIIASDTVRWVMGPSGTTVTFPNEMGLPTIFNTKPCSYPAPREKCAGPSCTNPYKYRDSESNLPLCSLQCYKAIHGKIRPLTAC